MKLVGNSRRTRTHIGLRELAFDSHVRETFPSSMTFPEPHHVQSSPISRIDPQLENQLIVIIWYAYL